MAHILESAGNNGQTIRRYNIDATVGRNSRAQNRTTDVKLVQALLSIFFYEHGGEVWGGGRYAPPDAGQGGGNLRVDGKFGPITLSHINAFLDQSIRHGDEQINNDHGFDPMSTASGGLVVHGRRVYNVALVNLNNSCFDNDRPGSLRSVPLEQRSDIMQDHPDLASALKTVKRVRGSGGR